MKESENADLKAQSKALDDMSQALLASLETMVEEQERRAAEFANMSHSLSALPEVTPLPQEIPQMTEPQMIHTASAVEQVEPPVPARRVAPPPSAVRKSVAPPRAKAAEKAPETSKQKSQSEWNTIDWKALVEKDESNEEKSSVSGVMVVIILSVILFMVRACS